MSVLIFFLQQKTNPYRHSLKTGIKVITEIQAAIASRYRVKEADIKSDNIFRISRRKNENNT